MIKKVFLLIVLLVALCIATFIYVFSTISSPRSYSPPDRTDWVPIGPRALPYIGDESDLAGGDVLGFPTSYFRTLHGDTLNSDEVTIATAPVFEEDWLAESDTFNTEGPTFDSAGNLYFSPTFSPDETVRLISLNPDDGSRRWIMTGAEKGSGAPLVLNDPETPDAQIVYAGGYGWAAAVRPNADINGDQLIDASEVIWEVETGLSPTSDGRTRHMFGLNYDPTTDTLIGQTRDNHIYVLDRRTGTQRLAAPYSLPGIAPSPTQGPSSASERIQSRIEEIAKPFFGDISFQDLIGILLGNNTMVANYFSIDPHTGRIWVAATAPDAEDGSADGISEYGALYCLKLVPSLEGLLEMEYQFHISFAGGSASTPALSADGQRVYIADNFGKLIAIDANDGSRIWELQVEGQIVGSISVASDNGELYLPEATGLLKVIDQGPSGVLAWRANLDMFPEFGINRNVRSLTATITANGIAFMGASEIKRGPGLVVAVGTGLIDRATGEVRYFTQGRDDSVAVTALGPDGAIYVAHSPVKRMFAKAVLGNRVPPLTGGIQKYAPTRLDLLIRDAIHAATDRAENVASNGDAWSVALKAVEVSQIRSLIDQARGASSRAMSDADLTAAQWSEIAQHLDAAELALTASNFDKAAQSLQRANRIL
ncbi:MAG: PQQ-binding-like beta-propeller repeat protein [Pseudomonadota bacterium]